MTGCIYDAFGNRTAENFSGTPPQNAPPIPGSSTDTYNAGNQIQSVDSGELPAPTYDPSGDGDVIKDSQGQQYLYDAEGRICAVNGLGGMREYLYDAEGNRIAKGTIISWSCDTTTNGFLPTASYILKSRP